jgi:hypothetical protein
LTGFKLKLALTTAAFVVLPAAEALARSSWGVTFLAWGTFLRRAANMRAEVQCRNGHYAWLAPHELAWSVCPSCAGWWAKRP